MRGTGQRRRDVDLMIPDASAAPPARQSAGPAGCLSSAVSVHGEPSRGGGTAFKAMALTLLKVASRVDAD